MKKLIALFSLLIPMSLFSQNIDIELLRKIYSPDDLPSDQFFRVASDANKYVISGVPVTMAVAGLVTHDMEMLKNAGFMAAGTVINNGITQALKHTINRRRPFETYNDIINKTGKPDDMDPSFPSGHTSTAFATATALSLDYPEWYIIAPSYTYAGIVAYSRMHLGVHYPSDVLASAIIGSGCAYLAHFVNRKLNGGSSK